MRELINLCEMPKKPNVYLRIGDWNPDRPYSKNWARGTLEKGLSVYDLGDDGLPVAPTGSEWAEQDMRERLHSDEPKYLVTGRRVGTGHDGEPLLRDPKVIGEWKP